MEKRAFLTFGAVALATTGLVWACRQPPGPAASAPATLVFEEALGDYLDARQEAEDAAALSDEAAMLAVRERFVAMTGTPELSAEAHYHAGYVSSMLSSLTAEDRVEESLAHADDGIAQLRAAIRERPDFADAYALLSIVYGQRLIHNSTEIFSIGGDASDAMERALELEPDNPRVIMLHSVRLLRLPGFSAATPTRRRPASSGRWTPSTRGSPPIRSTRCGDARTPSSGRASR